MVDQYCVSKCCRCIDKNDTFVFDNVNVGRNVNNSITSLHHWVQSL